MEVKKDGGYACPRCREVHMNARPNSFAMALCGRCYLNYKQARRIVEEVKILRREWAELMGHKSRGRSHVDLYWKEV